MMSRIVQSENIVKKYLIDLGWEPQKKDSFRHSSIPDFLCSERRYVEVKMVSTSNSFYINDEQIKSWYELSKKNYHIYLAVVDRQENIFMFKICKPILVLNKKRKIMDSLCKKKGWKIWKEYILGL